MAKGATSLSAEETQKILASTIAEVVSGKLNETERNLKNFANQNGEVSADIGKYHKDRLVNAAHEAAVNAIGLLALEQVGGPKLNAKVLAEFQKDAGKHADKMLANVPEFLGEVRSIEQQVGVLRGGIAEFREKYKLGPEKGIQKFAAGKELSDAETHELLSSKVIEATNSRINMFVRDIGGKSPKQVQTLTAKLKEELQSRRVDVILRLHDAGSDGTGPILDSTVRNSFNDNSKKHFDQVIATLPDFTGDEKQVKAAILKLRGDINKIATDAAAAQEASKSHKKDPVTPSLEQGAKKDLYSAETWNLLLEKAAEVAIRVGERGAEAVPLRHTKEALEVNMVNAFNAELINLGKKYNLDPKTAESLRQDNKAFFKEMLADVDESGVKNPKELEALKIKVEAFKETNKKAGIEDLVQDIPNFSDLTQKQSSLKTWNLLTEKAGDIALKLGEQAVSADMVKVFNKMLESQKNLDPQTVEAFKQNSAVYFDKMLEAKGNDLRAKIEGFKANTKVDPDHVKSGWVKVGNFCDSCGMVKLAEFCKEKHAHNVAKKISKELSDNLKKDSSKALADSKLEYNKPLASKHKSNSGRHQ